MGTGDRVRKLERVSKRDAVHIPQEAPLLRASRRAPYRVRSSMRRPGCVVRMSQSIL